MVLCQFVPYPGTVICTVQVRVRVPGAELPHIYMGFKSHIYTQLVEPAKTAPNQVLLHQRRKTASTQLKYNNYAGSSCPSDTPFKRCRYGLTPPSATARTRRLTAHGHLLLGCPCRWSSRSIRLKLEDALQALNPRLQCGHSKEDHLL